jgi:hypothetical protein
LSLSDLKLLVENYAVPQDVLARDPSLVEVNILSHFLPLL